MIDWWDRDEITESDALMQHIECAEEHRIE